MLFSSLLLSRLAPMLLPSFFVTNTIPRTDLTVGHQEPPNILSSRSHLLFCSLRLSCVSTEEEEATTTTRRTKTMPRKRTKKKKVKKLQRAQTTLPSKEKLHKQKEEEEIQRHSYKLLEQIRQGNQNATQEYKYMRPGFNKDENFDMKVRECLVRTGLIDVLLDLLQDCGTTTFEDAIAALPTGGRGANNAVVESPTSWTQALAVTIREGNLPEPLLSETCKMLIPRLKPLIECMCHPRREFFGSHDEWLYNLSNLAALFNNLAMAHGTELDMLQQHEEIPSFLVQCLCMRQCCPTIWEEVKILKFRASEFLEVWAAQALNVLMDSILPQQEGKLPSMVADRFTQLANTKTTFPSNMGEETNGKRSETLATCLMDVVVLAMTGCHEDDKLDLLLQIAWKLSLIDVLPVLDVIPELIALEPYTKFSGHRAVELATLIARSIYTILAGGRNSKQYELLNFMPHDKRYALAIQAGLLEMCLDLIVLYGNMDQELTKWVQLILQTAGIVSIEPKSEEAIQKRAPMIRAKVTSIQSGGGGGRGPNLHCVEVEMADYVHTILQNIAAANILVPSWTQTKTVFCSWCKLPMPKKASKRCSQCKMTFYCSKKCQKRDWKEGGHKQECKVMAKLNV